jgi:hypothetical protein
VQWSTGDGFAKFEMNWMALFNRGMTIGVPQARAHEEQRSGEAGMSTEKMDQLAAQSVFFVPEALSELRSAEIALRDGKYNDVAKYIAEASL